MRPEDKKHLFDILEAIKEIEIYVGGLDYNGYIRGNLIQSAVERKFEIIGEALNRLQHDNEESFQQIPDARRIISFRNILAHGYDIVDPAVIWDVIKNHLPTLKAHAERLMAI